jgi:kinesin family protein 11
VSQVNIIKGTGPRQLRNTFKFDSVYTSFSTQQQIFEETLSPIVNDVLNGFEYESILYESIVKPFCSGTAFCVQSR